VGFVVPTLLFAGALLLAVLLGWAATWLARRLRKPPPPEDPGISWALPPDPALPGIAADPVQLGDLVVRAASVTGTGWRYQEPTHPRRDAYRLAVDPRREHLVVAVADGSAGGRAGLGGHLAATTLVNDLCRRLDQGTPLHELVAADVYSSVAQSLVEGAQKRGIPIGSIYTTLIGMIVPARPLPDGRRVAWLASLGHSTAWLSLGDRWQHLGGELDSQSTPLLPFHPDKAVAALVDLPRRAVVALTTDGMARGLIGSGQRRTAEAWRLPPPIASFLADVGHLTENVNAQRLTDDRTAVVIWCGAA
jgi:Protein phosphatase 2C